VNLVEPGRVEGERVRRESARERERATEGRTHTTLEGLPIFQ